MHRVESLPETQALKLDLSKLRSVIHRLQKASLKLDKEKHEAIFKLRKLVLRWWRHRHGHGHHHHHHHHHHHDELSARFQGLFYRIKGWLRRYHGVHGQGGCPGSEFNWHLDKENRASEHSPVALQDLPRSLNLTSDFDRILGELYNMNFEDISDVYTHSLDEDHGHGHHKKWRKALFHAIHRVHVANNKLRSFESGLISKDGIKDREWFKHLGVAPGKWLGYGATTFPGLTEAIVLDQDKNAAEHEAERLVDLMEKMIKKLKA